VFEALIPIGREGLFSWEQWTSGSLSHAALMLLSVFAASAACVTEPLYIASGFSLYLNRRAELEAWDVELRFRSLAQRLPSDTAEKSVAPITAAAIVLLILVAATAHAQGASPSSDASPVTPTSSDTQSPAKRVVLDVLRDPVFGVEREAMEWRPRAAPGTNAAPRLPEWLRWIPAAVAVIATAGRYLVGIAAGVGLAWLLMRLQRRGIGPAALGGGAPAVLFGLDVRPESLPADLVGRARQLALTGSVTEALALLYRGALVALVNGAGVQFKDGDTERDCLRRAGSALQGVELAYFGTLVRSWQDAAYAHTSPHPDAVLGLCDRWPASFAVVEVRG